MAKACDKNVERPDVTHSGTADVSTRYTRWNILDIYFMFPSGKELIEIV